MLILYVCGGVEYIYSVMRNISKVCLNHGFVCLVKKHQNCTVDARRVLNEYSTTKMRNLLILLNLI